MTLLNVIPTSAKVFASTTVCIQILPISFNRNPPLGGGQLVLGNFQTAASRCANATAFLPRNDCTHAGLGWSLSRLTLPRSSVANAASPSAIVGDVPGKNAPVLSFIMISPIRNDFRRDRCQRGTSYAFFSFSWSAAGLEVSIALLNSTAPWHIHAASWLGCIATT